MSFNSVNVAAFATTTVLAATTIGATLLCASAAQTAATVAAVAYGILAILSFSLSAASISAWMATTDENASAKDYFALIPHHAGYAIAGTFQMIATTLFQAVVEGASKGISNSISRKIGGADVTVEYTERK